MQRWAGVSIHGLASPPSPLYGFTGWFWSFWWIVLTQSSWDNLCAWFVEIRVSFWTHVSSSSAPTGRVPSLRVFPCDNDLGCGSLQLGFCCHTLDGPGLELQIKWTVTEARGSALIATATNQWPRYYVLLDATGLHRQIKSWWNTSWLEFPN